jgi:hypothetical protein
MFGKLWLRQAARPMVGEAEGPSSAFNTQADNNSDMKASHDTPLLTIECGCTHKRKIRKVWDANFFAR